MNILIVDDEKTMIETLRRGLRTKGFKVLEALSGAEALEIINTGTDIELVISDYAMPKMNGIELVNAIRKTSAVPVILMTAYGDKAIVVEAMRNKCNGFIDKPFTLESLITEIKRHISLP